MVLNQVKLDSWKKMCEFLECRSKTLEAIENRSCNNTSKISSQIKANVNPIKRELKSSKSFILGVRACQLCSSATHRLNECNKFGS
jgi:hypothetical protein